MVDNVTRILLDRELHAELELVLSAPAEATAVLREIEEAVQNAPGEGAMGAAALQGKIHDQRLATVVGPCARGMRL
jgi:hypothetical protein